MLSKRLTSIVNSSVKLPQKHESIPGVNRSKSVLASSKQFSQAPKNLRQKPFTAANYSSVKFDADKITFLETAELLVQTALYCFKSDYRRGCLECCNALVRCCTNAHDIPVLKMAYSLMSDCYMQF